MKRLVCFCSVVLLICGVCFSCARTISTSTDDAQYLFNSVSDTAVTANDRYICISGDQPKLIDRSTGQEYKLPLSPFESTYVNQAFATPNGIYVLIDQEETELLYYDRQFRENVLLKTDSKFAEQGVFSLPSLKRTSTADWVGDGGIRFFFTDGSNVYLCYDDKIVSRSIRTNREKTILQADMLQNVSYANGRIYYTDQTYTLFVYDVENAVQTPLYAVTALDFVATGEQVIYRNLSDRNALYLYSEADQQSRKLIDDAVQYYMCVPEENALYYANDLDQIYRLDLQTLEANLLPITLQGEAFCKLPNEQKFVFISYPNGSLQAQIHAY